MTTSLDLARQGILIWQEIVGIKVTDTSFNLNNYDKFSDLKRAVTALEHDQSGVTSALLISAFFAAHKQNPRFSLDDVLSTSPRLQTALALGKEMEAVLGNPLLADAQAAFEAALVEAMTHYGASENPEVMAAIADAALIADLRQSAFNSLSKLRLDQFLRGEAEPESSKPVFVRQVYKWWNINSLLAAATRMPSGISLNLISNEDALGSFFAFVIRNGGNLYILSDRGRVDHPLQNGMRRRPDRVMNDRISQNWFPYDLADIEYDESTRKLKTKASAERGLVGYQVDLLPLAELKDLPTENLVWTTLMFSLIVDKFWKGGHQVEELSFTGEMVKNSQALLSVAQTANLPVQSGQIQPFTELDQTSISPENSTKAEIGDSFHNKDLWLQDRYGHRVSTELLNLTAPSDTVIQVVISKDAQAVVADETQLVERKAEGTCVYAAHKYPSTQFGTRQEIEQDRKFLARVNYADAIQTLADMEFKERSEQVRKWFMDRCKANAENLLALAHAESIWLFGGTGNLTSIHENHAPCRVTRGADGFQNENSESFKPNALNYRFMKVFSAKDSDRPWWREPLFSFRNNKTPLCNINGTEASYEVLFTPVVSEDLAFMAGCTVEELPDVLQKWDLKDGYHGNRILNRIDPIHWRLKNPWLDLDLRARFALSKRAMTAIEKANAPIPFANLVEVD